MPGPYRVSEESAATEERARVLESPDALGDLISTHRAARPHWTLFLATTFFVILVSAIAGKQPALVYLALGIPFVGVPLAVLSTFARRFHASVELREDGVVLDRTWTEPAVIPFDDVDEVYYDIRGFSLFNTIRFWGGKTITLVTFGGRRVVLAASLSGAHDLYLAVDRRVSRPLYAPAKKATKDGEALTFGPIALHDTFLFVNGESLSWTALACVEVFPERIDFVTKERALRFASIPIREIPHPLLLITLLEGRTPVGHTTGVWLQ